MRAKTPHLHDWKIVGHFDYCHFFQNIFTCDCGAVRKESYEREGDNLLLWMHEDQSCLRCNELMRGAPPKKTIEIIGDKNVWSPSGRYKKKALVVEAYQFFGDAPDTAKRIMEWAGDKVTGIFDQESDPYLIVMTLEGALRVSNGDWVIKGVQGEFYPCKPDIFEETYEVA